MGAMLFGRQQQIMLAKPPKLGEQLRTAPRSRLRIVISRNETETEKESEGSERARKDETSRFVDLLLQCRIKSLSLAHSS